MYLGRLLVGEMICRQYLRFEAYLGVCAHGVKNQISI
jgi:hypothetical protein